MSKLEAAAKAFLEVMNTTDPKGSMKTVFTIDRRFMVYEHDNVHGTWGYQSPEGSFVALLKFSNDGRHYTFCMRNV